uniref:Uncharacterized protein n=1 Tax=viral metagenome TaxID=1070528 RepID=A0A6H1ZB39_9ZZZZ
MPPSPQNSSTGVWRVFAAAGAVGYRLGTDAIDMATTWPGYTNQRSKNPPREFIFTGGNLSVIDELGITQVIPAALAAGVRLPCGVVTINAASTATHVLVMW